MTVDGGESIGVFRGLGPATGGRAYLHTATDSVLPNVLKLLAKEVLPYAYVAGYYPSPAEKAKRHDVQVVLLNKEKGELNGGSRVVLH